MGTRLTGRRAVVTETDTLMGAAIAGLLRAEGARVTEDCRDLSEPGAAERLIAKAGAIDILVINLSAPDFGSPTHQTSDSEWGAVFEKLVTPTHRLVRAALPKMLARRSGKIVVIGGQPAVRGRTNPSSLSAARGAQLAYARSVGLEVAPHNVQVNATGQAIAGAGAAELVLFLAGPGSDFISGQVLPYPGSPAGDMPMNVLAVPAQ